MSSQTLDRSFRWLAHLIQLGLVGIAGYAILVQRSVGLAINTGLPLGIALIPLYIRWRHDYRLNSVLVLLIVGGAAFHSVGSLGFYRSIGWFDQVAHGVGGALVAGVGYALVQVVDTQHDRIHVPPKLRFVFIVVFAVAVGVTWEVTEFGLERVAAMAGGEPLAAQYSLADVMLDLQFDVLGATALALWGTPYFDGLRSVFSKYVGSS